MNHQGISKSFHKTEKIQTESNCVQHDFNKIQIKNRRIIIGILHLWHRRNSFPHQVVIGNEKFINFATIKF